MTKIGVYVCLAGAALFGTGAFAQTPDANSGAGGDPLMGMGTSGVAKKKQGPHATGYGQKFNEDIGYGQKQHKATGYGKQPKVAPKPQQE
jgi:hypothetical protein